eukprot:497266-Hanusia_phi.AAC.1
MEEGRREDGRERAKGRKSGREGAGGRQGWRMEEETDHMLPDRLRVDMRRHERSKHDPTDKYVTVSSSVLAPLPAHPQQPLTSSMMVGWDVRREGEGSRTRRVTLRFLTELYKKDPDMFHPRMKSRYRLPSSSSSSSSSSLVFLLLVLVLVLVLELDCGGRETMFAEALILGPRHP